MTKCESCHDNTEKVHATPVAKWCCRDCDQKICNICHDAHKKIKNTRNHMICPYGQALEFYLNEVESFIANNVITPQISNIKKRFMDITIEGSIPKKRKVDE